MPRRPGPAQQRRTLATEVSQGSGKQDVLSEQQSLTAMRTILEHTLGTIMYLRYMVEDDEVQMKNIGKGILDFDDASDGVNPSTQVDVSSLLPESQQNGSGSTALRSWCFKRGGGERADHFLGALDGIMDAIEKGWLEKLIFFVYLDKDCPTDIVEAYTFRFDYTKEGPKVSCEIRMKDLSIDGKSKMKSASTSSGAAINKTDVYRTMKHILRDLYVDCQMLAPLPPTRFTSIKIIYNENAPEEYEPHGFSLANDTPLRMNTHGLEGDVHQAHHGTWFTGHQKLSVQTTSIAHILPAHYDHRKLKEKPNATKKRVYKDDQEQQDSAKARRVAWEEDEVAGFECVGVVTDDGLMPLADDSLPVPRRGCLLTYGRENERAILDVFGKAGSSIPIDPTQRISAAGSTVHIVPASDDMVDEESLPPTQPSLAPSSKIPLFLPTSGSLDNGGQNSASSDSETQKSTSTMGHTDPSSQEFEQAQDKGVSVTRRTTTRKPSVAPKAKPVPKSSKPKTTKKKTSSSPTGTQIKTPFAPNKKKAKSKSKKVSRISKPTTVITASDRITADKTRLVPTVQSSRKAKRSASALSADDKPIDCPCGDNVERDDDGNLEAPETSFVFCVGCKVWMHQVCVGILKEAAVPQDDYQCVLCEKHGDLEGETLDRYVAEFHHLALYRRIIFRARIDDEVQPVVALAEHLGATVDDIEACFAQMAEEGFVPRNGVRSTQVVVFSLSSHCKTTWNSYFRPRGTREAAMFDFDPLPSQDGAHAQAFPSSQNDSQSLRPQTAPRYASHLAPVPEDDGQEEEVDEMYLPTIPLPDYSATPTKKGSGLDVEVEDDIEVDETDQRGVDERSDEGAEAEESIEQYSTVAADKKGKGRMVGSRAPLRAGGGGRRASMLPGMQMPRVPEGGE